MTNFEAVKTTVAPKNGGGTFRAECQPKRDGLLSLS